MCLFSIYYALVCWYTFRSVLSSPHLSSCNNDLPIDFGVSVYFEGV